jgi:antitoxin component YwqK of YwqJK toxin-antitoxin module
MKNIIPRNNKGQQHGYWEMYNASGQLMYKCFYHNGKSVGYEERYFSRCYKLTTKRYNI